jgi:hypothetical protein
VREPGRAAASGGQVEVKRGRETVNKARRARPPVGDEAEAGQARALLLLRRDRPWCAAPFPPQKSGDEQGGAPAESDVDSPGDGVSLRTSSGSPPRLAPPLPREPTTPPCGLVGASLHRLAALSQEQEAERRGKGIGWCGHES